MLPIGEIIMNKTVIPP